MITYEVVYEDRYNAQSVVTVQADGFQLGHAGDAVFFTVAESTEYGMTSPAVNKYLFTRVIRITEVPQHSVGTVESLAVVPDVATGNA